MRYISRTKNANNATSRGHLFFAQKLLTY
jgi:hypothetical protein